VKRRLSYDQPEFSPLVNYEQARTSSRSTHAFARMSSFSMRTSRHQDLEFKDSDSTGRLKRLKSRYALSSRGLDPKTASTNFILDRRLPPIPPSLVPLVNSRFNREYYEFDERGRPGGVPQPRQAPGRAEAAHAEAAQERRRKRVAGPPGYPSLCRYDRQPAPTGTTARTNNTVSWPSASAERRALLPAEQQKLLRELAMMRMLCDSPYILSGAIEDGEDAPKLRELDEIIATALAEEGVKIIVFSEWVRMLELIAALLKRRKIGHATHTGLIPQQARRAEIKRFKYDPTCRVLLCSESGGVGLNLQVASVVINCDLPWNPARYEQRVARAWRKNQNRPVTVINLIAEDSIEQRMLATLAAKQELADGVLDGKESPSRMPVRGSGALLERVKQMIAPASQKPATPADPARLFGEMAHAALGPALLVCEERTAGPSVSDDALSRRGNGC
jgi:hypothetical protein